MGAIELCFMIGHPQIDHYLICKESWGYGIPDGAAERAQLCDICRQTLAFENHYLRRYQDYLLAELQAAEPVRQKFRPGAAKRT